MARASAPQDLGESLLLSLATNERINQVLLEQIDDERWSIKPEAGSGRTIAAIFSHMHNVRLMWLKAVAKDGPELPAKLDRSSVTRAEAQSALASSHRALGEAVTRSLATGKVANFSAGPAGFVGYIIAHDSHHRGQVCMLLRQLGARVPNDVMMAMWDWPKRAKEVRKE